MISAIYIFVFIGLSILYIGLNKKDSTLLMFSTLFLILAGLNIAVFGFGDLDRLYSVWLGTLIIVMAIYVSIRTAIEMIGK